MNTRFNVGALARMRDSYGIPKGKVVTITGVKVTKHENLIGVNGEQIDLVESVTCKELDACGLQPQQWYVESCFDGPLPPEEEPHNSPYNPGDRVTALKSIPRGFTSGYCIEAGQVYKVQSLDENGNLVFEEINKSLSPDMFEPAPAPLEPQWKAGDKVLLPVTLTSDRFENGIAMIQFDGSGSTNLWFKEDLDIAIPAPHDTEESKS